MYDKCDVYLTDKKAVTREIIEGYTEFLLQGFTIFGEPIVHSSIIGYLKAVNKHYTDNDKLEPFSLKDQSNVAKVLKKVKEFEKAQKRRDSLSDEALAKMLDLMIEDKNPLGFKAAVWNFTALGRFGGFRCGEFAMDSRTQIRYYILPNGELIVRCFVIQNFKMYDDTGDNVKDPLSNRRKVSHSGVEFDVQKNRMNGQIIKFTRLSRRFKHYCPVENQLDIMARAAYLGSTDPEDPLCVYRNEKGETNYLTGSDITAYYRDVMRTVRPNITDAELSLISTHSLRVYACVLLHEAGKDGPYIKLRLRWLSDCFEVYLRNTTRIRNQHNEALQGSTDNMIRLAIEALGLDGPIHVDGVLNLSYDDVADED